MEVLYILVGILPYLVEIYFLSYALRYEKPKPKRKSFDDFVSVVVPVHREPPSEVLQTLKHLEGQSYKNYEVLVMVNNTPEDSYKRPVELYCKTSSFCKYYDIEVKGFKGGVLNASNQFMNDKTTVVAVVDSDYRVEDQFIKKGLSYMDEEISIVQFPQDYRHFPKDIFHRAMYLAYRYFFAVIMRMCHVLNAVAFMGTVGFIKKDAITQAGRWSERIITEDSEMGLRLNIKGFRGIYVDETVGRGLMPLSWMSCRKQRFRWAYGNAQTILKYFYYLTVGKSLTLKQKVAFWVQNTVWHTPLLTSLILGFAGYKFSLLGLGLLLGFFLSKLYGFLYVYRKIDQLSFKDSLLALIFYLSLFFPMSYAPLRALVPVDVPFYRTPKESTKEKKLLIGEVVTGFLILSLFVLSLVRKDWGGFAISILSFPLFGSLAWALYQEKKSGRSVSRPLRASFVRSRISSNANLSQELR